MTKIKVEKCPICGSKITKQDDKNYKCSNAVPCFVVKNGVNIIGTSGDYLNLK